MDDHKILEFRVNTLESSVNEIKLAVKSIDGSLQVLARLEAHHAETRNGLGRAFDEIKALKDEDIGDHENRIRTIEGEMPTIKLIRNWVVSGVVSCVGMVAVAVALLVLHK